MKRKKLPIILFILCLCMIAVGVVGVVRKVKAADSEELAAAEMAANASRYGAETPYDVKTPGALPSQVKDYEGFRVSFNARNHTPNWVAWELLGAETDGEKSRSNKFWKDLELEGCPDTRDYSHSGYDRGHMCPAADQKWSQKAMEDCFSLANIVPQDNALNTGAWKTLENKERLWAMRDSAIWIVAGPIYTDSDKERIGSAGVRVPGAFFKVLAAPFAENPRGIAFVYPNMTAPGNMENYVMTIRDVEKLTGYDFFHRLPDDIEQKIETASSFREWNSRH